MKASIERAFPDSRGRFKRGPVHIITAELVAGLHLPGFKAKVATALDLKESWKGHPDLVYSVSQEAPEAWATVDQTDKLRRVQFRAKGAVARVGSAKEGKTGGRARRAGVECSLWRFEAARQLPELREGGSQNGRLHVQAEVGGSRGTVTGHCSAWGCDLWAAVLFPAKF